MKTDKYQRRFYRDWVKAQDLYLMRLSVKETDLQILTDKQPDKKFLLNKIGFYRRQIEDYISRDKKFLIALKPIEVEFNAAFIIKEMAKAAKKANVGPMATVAGAIATFLGKDLLRKGYKDIIIENGGDIFLATRKTRVIGIYSGRKNFFQKLALRIRPEDTPVGICTSSGTVGHSLSFGCADSIVVLSKNTLLADAVATAVGNLIKSKKDLESALNFGRSIKGILGIVIILKNNLISWGKIEFVK